MAAPRWQWDRPEIVTGFTSTPPNADLLQFTEAEARRLGAGATLLDLGCGAGRNAVPAARQGWRVVGLDSSVPMLRAARGWAREHGVSGQVQLLSARMDRLPLRDRSCDLVVAHGIWNLAASAAEFRGALREAARVARRGAGLFVFTFSRSTLAPAATPVRGEPFVFTDFSGQPQCFLTGRELVSELAEAGFTPDPAVALREMNRPEGRVLPVQRVPVIYQGTFRFGG